MTTPSNNTNDQKLISALRILANDIQTDDGIANTCIRQAAERLETLTEKFSDEMKILHREFTDEVEEISSKYAGYKPTEYTPMGKKKLAELIEDKGGEHIRDAKVIRFADGSECTISALGKVNWITERAAKPQQSEFWSHTDQPDYWEDDLSSIDQDEIFFDYQQKATVYKATGELLKPQNLLLNGALNRIMDEISESAHKSREDYEHYLPDYYLADFFAKPDTLDSLRTCLANWLQNNGQTNLYTIQDETITPVQVVESNGSLTEIEE